MSELSARRDLLTLDIDALERVQADYRGRLRAVLEKELEELDRRAALPPPARPELHEIDLSAVPVPPDDRASPESPRRRPSATTSAADGLGAAARTGRPGEAARRPRRWWCSTRSWPIPARPERAPAVVPDLPAVRAPVVHTAG